MRITFSFIITLSFFMLFSCKGDGDKSSAQAAPQQTLDANLKQYPPLPTELHAKLYNEVDFLDYIFHTMPFSMSQAEKPSVQNSISYITQQEVGGISPKCKAMARIFFQIQGEIITEADIYFGEGCYFYLFHIDNKPMYANVMSKAGIGFFQNTLNQALATTKQIQGQ